MGNIIKHKARMVQKHDIAENWEKASNFIPIQGEIIVYDDRVLIENEAGEVVDSTIVSPQVKYKIGDGLHTVNDLPFVNDITITGISESNER